MSREADNEAFVREVQLDLRSAGHQIIADGWAGERTQAAWREEMLTLLRKAKNDRPMGTRWPAPDQSSLMAFYGPPGSGQVTVPIPYPMRLAWDTDTTVERVTCHRLVAPSLTAALEEMRHRWGLDGLREMRMDLLGGVFNLRQMRDRDAWSVHAFGAAIDLDPEQNGLRTEWPDVATMPTEVIEIFEAQGWTSLGRVIGRDAMHMQATSWGTGGVR